MAWEKPARNSAEMRAQNLAKNWHSCTESGMARGIDKIDLICTELTYLAIKI